MLSNQMLVLSFCMLHIIVFFDLGVCFFVWADLCVCPFWVLDHNLTIYLAL